MSNSKTKSTNFQFSAARVLQKTSANFDAVNTKYAKCNNL